jgi:DNA repair protein RecN (Recombination protein N)
MLVHLSIRDIVLIRRLDIAFESGLSVLTGETGAGKSILLDALSLALGGRGDSSLVRAGASEGMVTAAFDLPPEHEVQQMLAAEAFDADEGTLILRRIQSTDGRSRGFINDRPASIALMRRIGASLVEIHGQHDEPLHPLIGPCYGSMQAKLPRNSRISDDATIVAGRPES